MLQTSLSTNITVIQSASPVHTTIRLKDQKYDLPSHGHVLVPPPPVRDERDLAPGAEAAAEPQPRAGVPPGRAPPQPQRGQPRGAL